MTRSERRNAKKGRKFYFVVPKDENLAVVCCEARRNADKMVEVTATMTNNLVQLWSKRFHSAMEAHALTDKLPDVFTREAGFKLEAEVKGHKKPLVEEVPQAAE